MFDITSTGRCGQRFGRSLASAVFVSVALGSSGIGHAEQASANGWQFEFDEAQFPTSVSIAAPGNPSVRLGVACEGFSGHSVAFVDLDPQADIGNFVVEDAGILDRDQASAVYHLDRTPGFSRWLRSSSGAAVFILKPTEPLDFVRRIAFARSLDIGITSQRAQALGREPEPTFWASFALTGDHEPIRRMMAICGQALVQHFQDIPDYPVGLGLEVDLWGPKATLAYKNLLHEVGYYDGPINGEKEDAFYLAVRDMIENVRRRCQAGEFPDDPFVCVQLTVTVMIEGKLESGTTRPFVVTHLLDPEATLRWIGDLRAGD